jgi:hypothetical protein
MIDRYYEGAVPVYRVCCDICDTCLPPELSFQDAVDAAKEAGWKRAREEKGYIDVCAECAETND